MPETKQGLPIVQLDDQDGWERWLEENHEAADAGVWLKFAKKAAPVRTVSYAEAVETALCYGWIDGQVARYDEHFYLQRFTPRRKRSKWSEINRNAAARLIEAGRMKPSGLRAIEAAKADGRWDAAYPAQSKITVPDDLQARLDENPQAKAFFESLTGSTRYAFLYRLHDVSDPEKRAERIARYIELLASGRTLSEVERAPARVGRGRGGEGGRRDG